ncbi:hypothetical protein BHE74_00055336 [Ensete ventricosum]|nr:hypothetical protein BHE74_00055336 [Ensete ventricosum]
MGFYHLLGRSPYHHPSPPHRLLSLPSLLPLINPHATVAFCSQPTSLPHSRCHPCINRNRYPSSTLAAATRRWPPHATLPHCRLLYFTAATFFFFPPCD